MSEPIHPLQAMVNGINSALQRDRAESQMTLGALITALEALPADRQISGLGELMSYRGYYCDLAFEPSEEIETVDALLTRCREAMGKEFTGYKGGEFMMGTSTPLWIASYGYGGGDRLMSLDASSGIIKPVGAPQEY